MRGVNKATILGNLGADPETRHTQAGTAITNMRVATSYRPKDGDEQTEWHSVVLFGRTAELASEYLRKGSKVYVEGRIQTRSWETDGGEKKYRTEIVGNDVQFLGGDNRPANNPKQAPASTGPADYDDDIPF